MIIKEIPPVCWRPRRSSTWCMTVSTLTETQVDRVFQSLHDGLVEGMERLQVPGLSLGVIDEGREHLASFGVTNMEALSPVTGQTLYQIG